jgi:alpha-glucosidase
VHSRNDILTYRRPGPGGAILVALNIVHEPRKLNCSCEGRLLLSTYLDREDEPTSAPRLLRPSEGIIVRLVDQRNEKQRVAVAGSGRGRPRRGEP